MRSNLLLFALCCCPAAIAQSPWQAEEFPVACWRGPRPSHNTLEHYQRLRDCGFNVVGPTGGYSREDQLEMLDLCEQVELRVIVADGRIGWQMTARDDWQDLVAQVVDDYACHSALYGYYLRDEPSSLLFEALGKISRELERQDPAHLPYINLFPTYATVDQLGTPTYEDHLIRFMEITTPRLISYDHYALLKNGGTRPDYYENMELVRAVSMRTGIPWWYVHHSGAYSGYREPTVAEMRWQVYTSLAYGTKGISYWYYWGREQEDDDRSGVVDSSGEPTRLYHILKELNAETRILGAVLLPLTCTDVCHVGEIPAGAKRLGTDAIVQIPEDKPLMVGFFLSETDTQYVMIVNRDFSHATAFEATFLSHVIGVERISPKDGEPAELSLEGCELALNLDAGDGILLRLTTEFEYPQPPETLSEIDFHFDRKGDMEGWEGLTNLGAPEVADGTLTMALGERDPNFSRMYLQIAQDTCQALRVRMRVTSGLPEAQVFWVTSEEPVFADTKYMNFDIVPDGEWHEYEIPVGKHERWSGKEIRGIRLDPSVGGAAQGAVVEIDWIVGVVDEKR